MAPEVVDGKPYGAACDVWSLGVILFEVLTLTRPFDASSLGALIMNIHSCQYDEAALERCGHHPTLRTLASREALLHLDPTERLGIEGLRVRMLDLMWGDEFAESGTVFGAQRDALLDLLWPGANADRATDQGDGGGLPLSRRSTQRLDHGAEHGALSRRSSPRSTERGTDRSTDDGDGGGATTVLPSPPPSGASSAAPVRPRLPSAFTDAPTWTQHELTTALSKVPRIPTAELTRGRLLGAGTFGDVCLATWRSATHPVALAAGGELEVAVKTLFAVARQETQVNELCKEATLLCAARHENVVALYGLSVGADASLALVMEFADGGSLFGLLNGRRRAAREHAAALELLEGARLLRLLRGTAQGMAFLHARGIMHRDLKSLNLLLETAPERIKVCDFGLSKQAFETAQMTRVGSVQWAAPEVLLGISYGRKADVWSFGVIAWEVLTGRIPYDGMNRVDVARGVATAELRLQMPVVDPGRCPTELVRLLRNTFEAEAERPEFSDVVNILDACEAKLDPAANSDSYS